jgi:hypothetical protein
LGLMRKLSWFALLVLLNLCVPLLVLEWVYRTQMVDTYRPELRAFNPAQVLADDGRPTLLLLGDSFTAGRTSYAGLLQETLQEWRVINAAVSGTGVLQVLYMAPRRFAHFHPTIFVYQVYVGNDLFDIRYPTNWRTISPVRNLYWLLANYLRVIGYVNYRLGHLSVMPAVSQPQALSVRGATTAVAAAEPAETFAVEHYDARVKTYIRAEPALVEDSILVHNHRQRDYAIFLAQLEKLLALCKPEVCRAHILVIPHVCQVDEAHLTQMRQLGAHFTTPAALGLTEYPFLAGLRKRFVAWSHVQVLNPLPMLRAERTKHAVYYANDDHLNPRGQAAIAAFLVQQLNLR